MELDRIDQFLRIEANQPLGEAGLDHRLVVLLFFECAKHTIELLGATVIDSNPRVEMPQCLISVPGSSGSPDPD
ncbi:MAG: hypothetical protein NTW87_00305 [Planctomycetota bacterium]|nr:hypothetical protein [Planctomycetota bacterium]